MRRYKGVNRILKIHMKRKRGEGIKEKSTSKTEVYKENEYERDDD